MSVDAVFFDAGHTLVYAHPTLGEVYAAVAADFGARVPPRRFADAAAPIFRDGFREAQNRGASDEHDRVMWRSITTRLHGALPEMAGVDRDAWFEALWEKFGLPEVWRLYDDVEPVLRQLKRTGLRIGVISNWDSRLRQIMAGLGLLDLIDFAVVSSEFGARKPDPRIFRRALELSGTRPDRTVHVGDLYDDDVVGARAAGIRPVLIDRRGQGLIPPPADAPTIASLAELRPHLA